MAWVAGIDGCRSGWIAVLLNIETRETRYRELPDQVSTVLDLAEKPKVIAIDVPIGLLDKAKCGGRVCDSRAREILGQPRARSVFSPPIRRALLCKTYREALASNRDSSIDRVGISVQCFCLFPKIRQVDEWIDTKKQKNVREVHPELCFYEMNGQRSMKHGKKRNEGLRERRELLANRGYQGVIVDTLANILRKAVAEDDILDACAACWTAERILRREARPIPQNPPRDRKGLRMEMVC
jgi:predicted RNase H-like nuclease